MKIDIRFVDAGYELLILTEYLELLEANTPEILQKEKTRILSTQHDEDEEVNWSIALHLAGRLEDGIITRFLPAGVVMASWAIYEAAVREIAEWLQTKNQVTTSLADPSLRGGLLKRMRKYFKDHLHFELHPRLTDWQRLERMSELRHVLAHSNGSLRAVSKAKRDSLRAWVSSTPGLVIEDHYIIVSLSFASEAVLLVRELLDELAVRVRQTYPLSR